MRSLIVVFFLLVGFNCYSQIEAVEKFSYKGNYYSYFVFNADSCNSQNLKFVQSDTLYYYDELRQKAEYSNSFIINSCITDSVCNPVGLFIDNGITKFPLNNNSGSGNFYLKPNGCLLVSDFNIEILETKQVGTKQYLNGIQSGPMLIINNQINLQFSTNSNNKNRRSAVGEFYVGGVKKIVFCASLVNVSFYEISDFLLNSFKCSSALNLESGNAFIYFPGMDSSAFNNNTTICNFTCFSFLK